MKIKFDLNLGIKGKFILLPIAISAILIFIGIILGDPAVLGNLIFISLFIALVPYFLYRYTRFLWIKSIENQFPNFVRDMADSIRSGMSFSEAIGITTKSNYGKLTQLVIKMNNRLSWGTPLLRTLEVFGAEVKDSKIIKEALRIIKQSYESGGEAASTLDSIANDLLLLKEAEAERNSIVRQHVFIMYGIFYLFLGVAIMIIFIMVPIIENQLLPTDAQQQNLGFTFVNPCEGVFFFPCDYFNGVAVMFSIKEGVGAYYTAMFFTIILIQGLFTGLIAGQLGSNSVIAGVKHALLMIFSSVGIFFFIVKAGLLPI